METNSKWLLFAVPVMLVVPAMASSSIGTPQH